MKQITIAVPDKRLAFFMELIGSLGFVQLTQHELVDDTLSPAQKETWALIKTGFDELKEVQQGKRKARPVQALLDELDGL